MTQAEHDKLAEKDDLGRYRLSCESAVTHDLTVLPLMTLTSSGPEDAGPTPAEAISPEPVWTVKP